MPDAQQDLAALGIEVTAQHGACFDGITFLSGRHQVTASFERGHGIGVRRLQLHALLVARCQELGVRLAWGTRVSAHDGQPMQLDGERCSYRYVVGADGQCSRVRQCAGLGEGKVLSRRFGARCHYRLKPWSRMVEVHWGELGQAYITPVGPEEICVATVARSSASRMDAVLASLPTLRDRLNGATELSKLRGSLTTTRKLRRVTAGNLALAGDASGSADAITGEGIALALRQALLLAEAIEADTLAIYESGHPAILRLPHLMSRAMLLMDGRPWVRGPVMGFLSAQPNVFAHLLATHLGHRSLFSFGLQHAPPLRGLGEENQHGISAG
jgi:flavin-dependent dehydrogenase